MTIQIPAIARGLDLRGRRVLVAGGSRGIGLASALGFAAAGASVSICARDESVLAQAGERLAAFGHPIHTQRCDLAQPDEIQAWVESAARSLGGIDTLVNNASGFGMGDDEAAWQANVQVDLMGLVRTSQAALPHLERGREPAIVNLSSIAGVRPSVRISAYGAIKAAINHYTSTQAAAYARRGIRVNAVAPGSIEFEGGLWARRKLEQPRLYEGTLASIPFGRFGAAEDVAELIVFLGSPLARWITAQTIVVDGGQLLGA